MHAAIERNIAKLDATRADLTAAITNAEQAIESAEQTWKAQTQLEHEHRVRRDAIDERRRVVSMNAAPLQMEARSINEEYQTAFRDKEAADAKRSDLLQRAQDLNDKIGTRWAIVRIFSLAATV